MSDELNKILEFNRKFVESKEYEKFATSKFPDKKIAIVTCMDTRLVELLPAALGIKNGDVKLIKNAGSVITDPFDSTMRSILVAVYELGVEQVMIIGHTECGVQGMNGTHMLHDMEKRGISSRTIETIENCGIDLKKWLTGFDDTAKAVEDTVKLVKNHPLLPEGIDVTGYIIDTYTGELTQV